MKFLLLVAVAGLAALANANIQIPGFPGLPGLPGVPGLPKIPGLSNLLPKGKRDVMDTLKDLTKNNKFMKEFANLVEMTTGEKLPRLSKRGLPGMLSGAQDMVFLPATWMSDLAAGGKMAMGKMKNDLGKRSIPDETHDVQKRDVMMDLLNMLIGNFEGGASGMDIGG